MCVRFTETMLTAVHDDSHANSIHPNIPTFHFFFFLLFSLSLSLSLQVFYSALARVHLRDHKLPTQVNSWHISTLSARHKVFVLDHCSPREHLDHNPQ